MLKGLETKVEKEERLMAYHDEPEPNPRNGWIFLAVVFGLAIWGLFVLNDLVTPDPIMWEE